MLDATVRIRTHLSFQDECCKTCIYKYTVLRRNNLATRSSSERYQNARSGFGSKSSSDIVINQLKPTAKQTARLDRRWAGIDSGISLYVYDD